MLEPSLGVDRRHAPRSRRGHRLAVGVVLHVATGEHTLDVGVRRAGHGDQVAVLVGVQHTSEQVGVRAVPDGDEQPAHVQCGRGPGVHVAHDRALETVAAQQVVDDGVPQELDLRVGERAVLHDLRRPQRIAAVHDGDLVGELGEEQRLFERRVTPTDDGDLLAAEEEPVARGARRQAVAEQARLGVDAEHQRACASADDDGVGLVHGVADPHLERLAGEIDLGRLLRDQLGAEARRLLAEVLHQVGPHDPVGKAGVVLDVRRQHQLPTGLVARARRLTLDDERGQVGAGGVDRRRQPGRTGADDDDVANGVGRGVAHATKDLSYSAWRFLSTNAPARQRIPPMMR